MQSESSSSSEGVWIGLDLGTSNSACAVWDNSRGSPKWMRLPETLALPDGSKWGRLVPSVVKISQPPLVGAQAMKISYDTGSLISSVKRLLGRTLAELHQGEYRLSSPFPVVENEKGELLLEVQDTRGHTVHITPVQVLGVLLRELRLGAEKYLTKYALRKNLDVPMTGGPASSSFPVRNVVIGVPAHFSKRQTQLVEAAARLGGFEGAISTCLESTAAAMAYGLSLQEASNDSTIMVLDMGGGTSDITVAQKRSPQTENGTSSNDDTTLSSYRVLLTEGEERLGGDDIDQAIMDYCLEKTSTPLLEGSNSKLLQFCRATKEALCDLEAPSISGAIALEDAAGKVREKVEIDQDQFDRLLQPWLDKARSLIQRSLDQLEQVSPGTCISEVILVGGTTRIPAIRNMVQTDFFPTIELSTSLNPMSSVAQGLAIQAALLSKCFPAHQLRSALMLDCIPHAIGVLLAGDDSTFVEILPRNAPLPAQGSTTFTLADKLQPGVTIQAVEKISTDPPVYEPMREEPFTFLLRRLPKSDLDIVPTRSIEVGMKIDTEGRFIVSIFDELDPEQVRKRARYESQGRVIGYEQADVRTVLQILWQDSQFSSDQFMLVGLLVATLMMYIAVKVAFSHELMVVSDE